MEQYWQAFKNKYFLKYDKNLRSYQHRKSKILPVLLNR